MDTRSRAARVISVPNMGQVSGTEHLLSDRTTVRQLVSQLSRLPDVRLEQVNALRSEIQSGQFQRGNDLVAGAIVAQLFGIDSNG
jgi:hypothetical protein